MKFYEDQHKLAVYLERTGAKFQFKASRTPENAEWKDGGLCTNATSALDTFGQIRPVLRYGLPSHLQSEIHNPDNLTEEQICEGGKYRAVLKSECDGKMRLGAMYWSPAKKWYFYAQESSIMSVHNTMRLPAEVPWPDWEREEAAQPDLKDARIAELEADLAQAKDLLDRAQEQMQANSLQLAMKDYALAASLWRRMSEVPTEEDFEGGDGYIVIRLESGSLQWLHQRNYISSTFPSSFLAWMSVPKFHGWPDPLADLLKQHGIEATPELTAALTAWKEVEK